ncbi:MAG: tRNA (N(6)-L-threonylcarbamoyladenosine(37)-C(2))-methylthiotransferase MtaB [Bacilli bacterium]|nr:tRNA (N(6)-L-threonylcarbamoyladenosine(37)-C(2))-methylthiotransferase MtaB [Bacilli bacterium]
MTFSIYTLGCKVNLYESEFVANLLKKNKYTEKEFSDFCDVYIINTCSVTNNADSKSMKMIRNAKKRNPEACIVAMGCFVEKSKDNLDKINECADIIIGTKDKSKIVELLDKFFEDKKRITRLYDYLAKDSFEDMYIDNFASRTRAFVKIQDGCENFCSYCIIPFVRGKRRSKDFDKVIEEITSLVNNGYQEIVLTGIHTGSYGVDINSSFASLLREIVKIKELKRLRISSIEITELNDEVLALLREDNVIVDHLHIPLQSGCDKILKLMNRKYDLAYFENKLKEIRKIRKDIAITTDVIVGFPGESDEDFRETVDTVKHFEFAKIHVFPYSLREGTKAATMTDQVDGRVKKERAKTLGEVSKELEINYMNKFIGKDLLVLTEEVKDGFTYGHTSNYLHIKINKELKPNTFIKVHLIKVNYPYVEGEPNDLH